MKKNTKVSWQIQGAPFRGKGITISDEDELGTVLVAVGDYGLFTPVDLHSVTELLQTPSGFHPVIHCTVTWLTVEA